MSGWTVVPNPSSSGSSDTSAWTPVAKYDFSSLLHNPKGEGTYQIKTPDGQTVQVPYSNVPVFQGLQGTSFVSPKEQARFEKDAAADPHRPTWWNALTNPVGSGGREQGPAGGALQVGGQAVKAMVQPFVHPIDTAKGIAKVAGDAAIYGPSYAAGKDVVEPAVEQYEQDKQQGGNALAIENLAGQGLGTVEGGRLIPVGELAERGRAAFNAARDAARTTIAGDVNVPIPGTDVTPAARYQSMKAMGVQPNAAEATNSTPLNMAEKVNQNSLTAQPTYVRARAANMAALNRFTNRLLDTMSPVGAEEGGAAVQQGLRNAQAALQKNAAQGFSDLDEAMGNRKLSGQTVQQTAKSIYDSYAPYADAHPTLVPKEAWKIVKDLAGADNGFQSRPMSFPEVHQLRSDLLEMVRSNPDIVKNQAGAWLQRLADAADQTITSGATGLSPEGTQIFRDANEAWANMKGAYDNPSHPFYQAVRTPSPSTLVKGIGGQSPEIMKLVQQALGPEGVGPIQRGVAEKVLGRTKEGGYNFKNFQGQWNKLPQAYREALFTPEQIAQFEDIGNAGTVLHEDLNPSGSAKLGQGLAEMGEAGGALTPAVMGHPMPLAMTGAYHAAQYALSRLMNSPKFVDWLMKDTTPAGGFNGAPAAPGSFAEARAMSSGGLPMGELAARSKAAFDAARAE